MSRHKIHRVVIVDYPDARLRSMSAQELKDAGEHEIAKLQALQLRADQQLAFFKSESQSLIAAKQAYEHSHLKFSKQPSDLQEYADKVAALKRQYTSLVESNNRFMNDWTGAYAKTKANALSIYIELRRRLGR